MTTYTLLPSTIDRPPMMSFSSSISTWTHAAVLVQPLSRICSFFLLTCVLFTGESSRSSSSTLQLHLHFCGASSSPLRPLAQGPATPPPSPSIIKDREEPLPPPPRRRPSSVGAALVRVVAGPREVQVAGTAVLAGEQINVPETESFSLSSSLEVQVPQQHRPAGRGSERTTQQEEINTRRLACFRLLERRAQFPPPGSSDFETRAATSRHESQRQGQREREGYQRAGRGRGAGNGRRGRGGIASASSRSSDSASSSSEGSSSSSRNRRPSRASLSPGTSAAVKTRSLDEIPPKASDEQDEERWSTVANYGPQQPAFAKLSLLHQSCMDYEDFVFAEQEQPDLVGTWWSYESTTANRCGPRRRISSASSSLETTTMAEEDQHGRISSKSADQLYGRSSSKSASFCSSSGSGYGGVVRTRDSLPSCSSSGLGYGGVVRTRDSLPSCSSSGPGYGGVRTRDSLPPWGSHSSAAVAPPSPPVSPSPASASPKAARFIDQAGEFIGPKNAVDELPLPPMKQEGTTGSTTWQNERATGRRVTPTLSHRGRRGNASKSSHVDEQRQMQEQVVVRAMSLPVAKTSAPQEAPRWSSAATAVPLPTEEDVLGKNTRRPPTPPSLRTPEDGWRSLRPLKLVRSGRSSSAPPADVGRDHKHDEDDLHSEDGDALVAPVTQVEPLVQPRCYTQPSSFSPGLPMHAESALEGPAEAVFYAGGPAVVLRSRIHLSRQLSHPSVFGVSDGENSSFWCYSDTETCSRQLTGESHRSGSSRTEGNGNGNHNDHQQYELVEQNLMELQRQSGHGFMRMPGTDRGVS